MIESGIKDFLKVNGIGVIEDANAEGLILTWRHWYIGKVPNFHEYKVYNGKKHIPCVRASLNMTQEICKKWADLLLNEKVFFSCTDETTGEHLNRLLKQVNFWVRGNNLLESSFGVGGGAFIQYWDGTQTKQEYVTQEFMLPVSYDSGEMTEAVFVSDKVVDGDLYIYIQAHTEEENGHQVRNFLLKKKGKKYIEADAKTYEDAGFNSEGEQGAVKLFQVIRPNVANRLYFNSPYGTSIISGCEDTLRALDCEFDSLYNEFLLGRKRIFVKNDLTTYAQSDTGEKIPVFDPNDGVFYSLPDDAEHEPIKEVNMDLRVEQHTLAIERCLSVLSNKVGFGAEGFRWENGRINTATQVMSENSDQYRTVKKHEILLEKALIEMAKGLLYVEYTHNPEASDINLDAEITVNFDDSIIEDTAEIKKQALLDFNSGLIDRVQYFVETRGMTVEEAQRFVEEMQSRVPEEPDAE